MDIMYKIGIIGINMDKYGKIKEEKAKLVQKAK
jgi:hypothetical protein